MFKEHKNIRIFCDLKWVKYSFKISQTNHRHPHFKNNFYFKIMLKFLNKKLRMPKNINFAIYKFNEKIYYALWAF